MIPLPSGAKVWLATGHTDMRKGIGGLSLLVQEVLGRDPFCGHLFVFRGRRSDLIKIVWHDGQVNRPRSSRFMNRQPPWPSASDGAVPITPAQLAYLTEGIDWRNPQQTWRPTQAG